MPEIQQISIPYVQGQSGDVTWSFDLSFRGFTATGIGNPGTSTGGANGASIVAAITSALNNANGIHPAPYFGSVVVAGDPNTIDASQDYYQVLTLSSPSSLSFFFLTEVTQPRSK